ncbi:kinase-like domain-containing protein [Haematococcus lacustris]
MSGRTYDIVRKLGNGAFGEVLLARAVETGEVVAIKRVYVRQVSDGIPDNVLREIKCMQCIDHPNVVRLKDVYVKGHSIMMVQEFCSTDLARLLRQQHCRLAPSLIKAMVMQLLQGLAACHAAGILHRDLKPSNILITHQGCLKVADFGLARPHSGGARPTYTHTVATRWYRAPELLYGARAYGPAVDLWAVGAILAELLGLSPLIPGENDIDQLGRTLRLLGPIEDAWPAAMHLPDYGKVGFPPCQPVQLVELLPAASAAALDLLASLLRYNPEERPSAASALMHPFFANEPLPVQPSDIARLLRRSAAASAAVDAALDACK